LTTISAYQKLTDMSPLTPGTYIWDVEVPWQFADATETQNAQVEVTYSIK